jgi:D-beta-D-heptose 7-phosphate kinase/D-beta-D-heptose 1-phosphate adenosyltransferase
MSDIFSRFGRQRILVVGDVMLDRYWWGSVERISPEAPVPIVRMDRTSLVCGGAANVALNLAGLGATPILVGIKGDDAEGRAFDEVLDQAGISPDHLQTISGRRTTIKTRIVAHQQHVVRIDQETSDEIDDSQVDGLTNAIDRLIPECDAVIISDYAKGFLTKRLIGNVINSAQLSGKPVLVDPKGRDFEKYRGAAVLTPNRREAAEAGQYMGGDGQPDFLRRHLDLSALLVTEGEDGMTLYGADGRRDHLDSLAREVYDVTGAGDTVIATFTAAAAAGLGFLDAAALANAAAGLVVGTLGTSHITRPILEEYLAENRPFPDAAD